MQSAERTCRNSSPKARLNRKRSPMLGMLSLHFSMPTTSLAGRGLLGCLRSPNVPPFSFSRSRQREIPRGCKEATPARLSINPSPWPRLPPSVAESLGGEGGAITRLGIKRPESLDPARCCAPAWPGLGRLRASMTHGAKRLMWPHAPHQSPRKFMRATENGNL